MGDLLKIVTRPLQQNTFIKVTSNALSFEVKALGNAAIGIAEKPGPQCDFWVAIGHADKCWINGINTPDNSKVVDTPGILSSEEYRKFWISWDKGCLRLGRGGEDTPIVKYHSRIDNMSYVTFSAMNDNMVAWKFELPPFLGKSSIQTISGGELHWILGGPVLATDAIIGGYENEAVYIIRAKHRGSVTPGKFIPSQGLAYISWGGVAYEKPEYETLCGFNCIWVPTSEDKIPVGAVEAGYSEVSREKLYVGRGVHNGHIIPGKVQPSHKVCYIPYRGIEIGIKNYEVLTIPHKKSHFANRMLIPHININLGYGEDEEEEEMDYDNGDL